MTVTIALQRAKLATAAAAVTGITKAFDYIPRTLQNVELPAAVIVAGRAAYDDTRGAEMFYKSRQFQLQVYVAEGGLGREGTAEDAAESLLETFANYFLARPVLDVTGNEAFRLIVTGDSGIVALNYPPGAGDGAGGKTYAGFIVEITTETSDYIAFTEG